METPSGKIYDTLDLAVLRHMHDVGFVRYSDTPFLLKSKTESNVYVFGREDLTDNAGLELNLGSNICRMVYQHTRDDRKPILIGLPTAGTALAQAAAMASLNPSLRVPQTRSLIGHRIMREQLKKSHGVHGGWVNGKPDHLNHRYWIIDNVATDGATKLEAIPKLEQDNYPARQMPVLICVDRQQGAVARLKKEGFIEIHVLFNLLDLSFAFRELGLWPKSVVLAVEQEIKAHQFAA